MALPVGLMTRGPAPPNFCPEIVGNVIPTAASFDGSVSCGSGEPSTDTALVCVLRATFELPPPPPPELATTAPMAAPMTTAATTPTSNQLRLDTIDLRLVAGPRPGENHRRGDGEETARRHERDGDDPEVFHPHDRARVGDVAHARFERWIVLEEYVVNRD